MDKDTFGNDAVAKFLNETFVNVSIDTDKDKATAEKFSVRGIPDSVFVDPASEKVLQRIVGNDPKFLSLVTVFKDIQAVEADLKARPDDVGVMIRAGDVYFGTGRNEEAGRLFAKAADSDAEDKSGRRVEALYKLGLALKKDDMHEEGESAWNAAASLDPENKKGYVDDIQFARCRELVDEEEYPDALRALGLFLERYPESEKLADAMFFKGVCQFWTEARDEAEKTWKEVVSKHAGTPAAEKAAKSLEFAKKRKQPK